MLLCNVPQIYVYYYSPRLQVIHRHTDTHKLSTYIMGISLLGIDTLTGGI
jgi:hypothetical protein